MLLLTVKLNCLFIPKNTIISLHIITCILMFYWIWKIFSLIRTFSGNFRVYKNRLCTSSNSRNNVFLYLNTVTCRIIVSVETDSIPKYRHSVCGTINVKYLYVICQISLVRHLVKFCFAFLHCRITYVMPHEEDFELETCLKWLYAVLKNTLKKPNKTVIG